MKSKQEWGWDSGLLRHRILKSLGIPENSSNKNKTLIGVLAESDDILDHLPFRMSDVVLNTDKFPVIAEMLSHQKNSVFWQTISQSDNVFMFCDPHRAVDSCLVFASRAPWFAENQSSFDLERKSITARIISYNKRLNLSAYACII
jgi:hypothetical protein